MRFLLSILMIAILSAVAEVFLPWWSVAVVSFLVSLLVTQTAGRAFLMGFAGIALCWLIAALLHDITNDHILSGRMATLFSLPDYGLFIAVTVFLGGMVGGMSSWAGSLLKTKH